MIADTSLMAYNDILEDVGELRLRIYNYLKTSGPCNNMMIHIGTGIGLSTVCGRMNELREKFKLVTFSHKDICPYNKKTTRFYKVINLNKQEDKKYG